MKYDFFLLFNKACTKGTKGLFASTHFVMLIAEWFISC